MSETAAHGCADCRWRARAEAAPRSFLGRLWHWHTRWCPGWKAYQRSLATSQQTDRENA